MKCDKLKVYKMIDEDYCDDSFCVMPSDVYLKSEADKCIESLRTDYKDACGKLHTVGLIKDELYHRLQHANYKRCVAMSAYWIAVRYKCIDEKHRRRADKNNKRWLELSKRYKETKE